MIRTHLALIFAFIFMFLPIVNNPVSFTIIALAATLLPDIDNGFSTLGKMQGSKIVQFFVKHRGIFHSLTFAVALTFIITVFFPVLGLGFFLGYSIHLFADSFTKEGISPFWPSKRKSSWVLNTGGRVETSIFVFLILIDILIAILIIR